MPNRLIHSASPYLLQHAHNPVDWFEWGTEALQKAKAEDKPILVSIGYSSCHWCHVMERESFENKDIAQIMNEFFICIKVDREERPDIDHIYMDAVQAMQQNGGWPLNVFLTPEQKPFFGGTYFPPRNWAQLLHQISKAFRERRAEIDESAEDLKNHLLTSDVTRFAQTPSKVSVENLEEMFNKLMARFDLTRGGLDKAPKFVMPSIWQWLLRYHVLSKNEKALQMVMLTLRQVACGGIYDQLAGGFARYSVDGDWFAPHFEKMLYDNAQLLSLYSEAYTVTQDPLFKQTVFETIDWLEREMTHPEGGFYSALDADSEGIEGKYYTWTETELDEILGADASIIKQYYHSSESGNWEHGRSILYRNPESIQQPEPIELKTIKQKLLLARSRRIRPGLDDKVVTAWNAMTISGLIDSFRAFNQEHFLKLALDNIAFLEAYLIENGKVYRTFKNKHSETEGFLEDYAYLIQAYTNLYQVTFNEGWLYKAGYWCEYAIKNFFDQHDNFFHFSSATAEQLIARKKEVFDNVIPASNSVMARNLQVLATLLDKPSWSVLAEKMITSISALIISEPAYMSNWGMAMLEYTQGFSEIVISGDQALAYVRQIQKNFLPFSVMAGTLSRSDLPLLNGRGAIAGRTIIYVCKNQVCKLPVENPAEALVQLQI